MSPSRAALAVVAATVATLLLWAWLFVTGTILVIDRGDALARAEVATGLGAEPLRRLPGGFWVGLPGADGTVRLICRDGRASDHGYVSGGSHAWFRVAKGRARCASVEEL